MSLAALWTSSMEGSLIALAARQQALIAQSRARERSSITAGELMAAKLDRATDISAIEKVQVGIPGQ
jgi:hypothetical protein